MTRTQRISESVRRVLQGIAAYVLPSSLMPSLDDESVESLRRGLGGQLAMPTRSKTRWEQQDIEIAELLADQGDMSLAGALMRSAHRDGVISGQMSTRCGGLVGLPKRFRGDSKMIDMLQSGGAEARSIFDEMCPPGELESIDRDGIELGVAVGELVPVDGRTHPVLHRLPPEHLRYIWNENRWYYQSVAGRLPITPGDGRWVLHTPGGRVYPWQNGLWRALGRCYVTKEHARLHRETWEATLANPARVVSSPVGAKEADRKDFFQKLKQWGVNAVFGLPIGWELKVLETNGQGAKSFKDTIREQDDEIIVITSGQTMTTTGGEGFANGDVGKGILAGLIKRDERGLAFTVNTQILPAWVELEYGAVSPDDVPSVSWDVDPPVDRKANADAMSAVAKMITDLDAAMTAKGRQLDVDALIAAYGIPVVAEGSGAKKSNATPAARTLRIAG